MKAPSKMMDKVVLGGPLRGFIPAAGGKSRDNFTHLLFVNDPSIFRDADLSRHHTFSISCIV